MSVFVYGLRKVKQDGEFLSPLLEFSVIDIGIQQGWEGANRNAQETILIYIFYMENYRC